MKASKLRFWWNPLIQSRKSITLKFTEELCAMTMKNDAKFKEEFTFRFKIDIRNLANFDLSTWKSQNFYFNALLLNKVYIVWAKKCTEELSFMTMKRDANYGEESTCRFKIDIRNLTNFDLSTQKSQKCSL